MVHQHFKLVDNYTMAENIVLGIEPMTKVRNLSECRYEDGKQEIAELSKTYGLEVNPDRPHRGCPGIRAAESGDPEDALQKSRNHDLR